MQIGVGIDPTLVLSEDEQQRLAREAAGLGYHSLWTTAPPEGGDPFRLCEAWYAASGLQTGVSVVPMPAWPIDRLAARAAAARTRTDGRLILGVGAGVERRAPIRLMRETARSLRTALPQVTVYLGALGPQMLRLAGERYDGAALNWSSPEQIAWSRELVADGARATGRDPAEVRIHQYIRVCVDQDARAARLAFATMVLRYALTRHGGDPTKGYRGHFGRMGFGEVLDEVERLQANGASDVELAARVPDAMLSRVGYWGRPGGASAAFAALSMGLDVAVVRVVASTHHHPEAVRLTMRSCLA